MKYKMDLHRYDGRENEHLGLESKSFILGHKSGVIIYDSCNLNYIKADLRK